MKIRTHDPNKRQWASVWLVFIILIVFNEWIHVMLYSAGFSPNEVTEVLRSDSNLRLVASAYLMFWLATIATGQHKVLAGSILIGLAGISRLFLGEYLWYGWVDLGICVYAAILCAEGLKDYLEDYRDFTTLPILPNPYK